MGTIQKTGTVKLMTPLVLGNMLNPLNSTMLATAIVSICLAFHQPPGAGALLIVPLYLTSAIGQPLMGKLCDVFSPYKINLLGFVLILISAIIGVSAQNFTWLIVSRILLGLGSSSAYPSSITLIRRHYTALGMQVPGRTLGIIAISGQVSLAIGPFLGGVLVEQFGWQGIFAVNIPLVILGLLLSIRKKGDPDLQDIKSKKSAADIFRDLDPLGLLLFCAFLISLLLTLLYSGYYFIKIPALLLSLALFVITELRHPKPFIDVRVLGLNWFMNSTLLRQMAINFIMYLIIYGLPQWLEQTKDISPSHVGLIMLPLSVAAMLASILLSKSSRHTALLSLGTLCIIGASIGLFLLHKQSGAFFVLLLSILIGAALGILSIANQSMLYKETPEGQVGVSFGLYRTLGYMGAIIAGSQLKHQFKQGATDAGLHTLALYSLATCVIIILLMLPVYFKRKVKTV